MKTKLIFILAFLAILGNLVIIKASEAPESSQTEDEEDFDLDLIDINTPKKLNKLLDEHFSQQDSFIDASQMIDLMYSFLLDENSDNIHIVQTKHENGKELKHKEEDLLSAAQTIQKMVKEYMEDNKVEVFDRSAAKKLLNREAYNEYIQNLADDLLKHIDAMAIDEYGFEPNFDL